MNLPPSPASNEEAFHQLRAAARDTARGIRALQRRAQVELVAAQQRLAVQARELAQSVSLLRATLESSPDGVVVLDLNARVVAYNSRYVQLWDFPPGLLEAGDSRALTAHAATRVHRGAWLTQRVAELLADPKTRGFDTVDLLDGRTYERWVAPQMVDGTCVGSVVNWRDVTERRQAEAMRRARDAAEAASRSKSAFLSRMSHELRTPLNAILGFSEVLELDRVDALTARQRERVAHIRNAGAHLLSLINDVLDVSRIEAGSPHLRIESLDASQAVAEAVRNVALLAADRHIDLDVEADARAEAMRVRVDRTRLQQVLLNLLSNAIKYNQPGGSVAVRLFAVPGRVRIAIVDTGIGMTEQQLAGLFQPFNRLGRETSPVQGTGIGLVITRNLVEMMGGTLRVQSQAGSGSEFVIDLERAAPDTAAGDRQALPGSRSDVHGCVLYIDDDPVNRLLVQALMDLRPGVTLHLAETGRSGIEAAIALQPRLVLIDIRLPDIGGEEVMRALRAHPFAQPPACIAVSANAMPQEVSDALAKGFDAYLTKPLSAAAFLAQVDQMLP